MALILASQSPRRKELLEQIGIAFGVEPSNAEENIAIKDPTKLVSELSRLKADDIWKKNKDACIIAADTIVFAQGEILGKPSNRSDGEKMLKMLSCQCIRVLQRNRMKKMEYIHTYVCVCIHTHI